MRCVVQSLSYTPLNSLAEDHCEAPVLRLKKYTRPSAVVSRCHWSSGTGIAAPQAASGAAEQPWRCGLQQEFTRTRLLSALRRLADGSADRLRNSTGRLLHARVCALAFTTMRLSVCAVLAWRLSFPTGNLAKNIICCLPSSNEVGYNSMRTHRARTFLATILTPS